MRFCGFDELLSHYAEASPDAPALKYEGPSGIQVCSFGSLYDAVKLKAEDLRSGGKTCIGVLADGSFDCVLTIFASVLAGLQVVLLDASASTPLLGELIGYADIDTLFGDDELCDELSPYLTAGVKDGRGRLLFFTSGTTNRSKAVVLTDESLMSSAWNGSEKLPLHPDDTLLCMLPLGHVFGFVCGLLWGLSSGCCVALGRGARHYFDDCRYFKPSAVSLVPMLLGFLIKQGCINEELKLILVGAGDCPAELLHAAQAMGIRVSFGYGLTETSSGVAISVSGDPFAMEVCPDDEIIIADDGEILIKAPTCMMKGYYKMSSATDEVFRNGILYSGDLGRFDDDGRLHITGRKKEMIVLSNGTKIFLPEYEAKLKTVLKTDELAVSERDGKIILILQECGVSEKEILEKIRPVTDELPRGQQIDSVSFRTEPLPRTSTGKIKRYEL